jgi:hypothetical protein
VVTVAGASMQWLILVVGIAAIVIMWGNWYRKHPEREPEFNELKRRIDELEGRLAREIEELKLRIYDLNARQRDTLTRFDKFRHRIYEDLFLTEPERAVRHLGNRRR